MDINSPLNLDLLLKGILLAIMVDIPAQSGEELVNEVLADFALLVRWREKMGFVRLKILGERLNQAEGSFNASGSGMAGGSFFALRPIPREQTIRTAVGQ